jgi:hypothetical protein
MSPDTRELNRDLLDSLSVSKTELIQSVSSPLHGYATASDPGVNEFIFQQDFLALAKELGWRRCHFDSAWSRGRFRTPVSGDNGLPDNILTNGRRVIWAELKTGRGSLSPEQRTWIELLRSAGQAVYVWRPKDWNEIVRVLSEVKE